LKESDEYLKESDEYLKESDEYLKELCLPLVHDSRFYYYILF